MDKLKTLVRLQMFLLLGGTIFAWFTVYTDFARFYNIYGSLTKISGCVIPNPVTTPCFYGAFAFLLGFIWSVGILAKFTKGNDISAKQKNLWYLLIAGTIFAWSNFTYEIYRFYTSTGAKISCSGVPTDNVFLTPCFFGAVIFLSALILSMIIRKKLQN